MNTVPAPRIICDTTGHFASSDFATKRTGCMRVQHEDVEPRDVVGDDEHVAAVRAELAVDARLDREDAQQPRAPALDERAPARVAHQREHEHRRRDAREHVHARARPAVAAAPAARCVRVRRGHRRRAIARVTRDRCRTSRDRARPRSSRLTAWFCAPRDAILSAPITDASPPVRSQSQPCAMPYSRPAR